MPASERVLSPEKKKKQCQGGVINLTAAEKISFIATEMFHSGRKSYGGFFLKKGSHLLFCSLFLKSCVLRKSY